VNWIYVVYFVVCLLTYIALCIFIYYVIDFSNSPDQQLEYVLCTERTTITILFPYYWVLLIILAFVFGLAVILSLYYKLVNNNSSIKSTKKLQLMLFKALVIQIVVIYTFVLIPILGIAFLHIFEVEDGANASMMCVAFMSFCELADYFVIVYFIKPYRTAFLKMVRFADPRSTCKFSAIVNLTKHYFLAQANVSVVSLKPKYSPATIRRFTL
jgi:hypothetical protein